MESEGIGGGERADWWVVNGWDGEREEGGFFEED